MNGAAGDAEHALLLLLQVDRWMEEFKYGRDYIDPAHVKDEGITHEDCRRWKVLQELQVSCL